MADVLGAASSVLALTIFAFQTSKAVYDSVCSFKSQRRTITDLQTDLQALNSVLDFIRQQAQTSEDDRKFEPLREPVKNCTTTCLEMQEMVSICTKHAKDGRDSVRDWLNMQYREKSFDEVKQRLASYKSTLSITFVSIGIQEHAITQDSLTELKRSIEGTKEDLEDQLDRVEGAIGNAEVSLRELLLTDRAQLRSSLDSLIQAQTVAENTRPQIVIEHNRAGEHSRTLFGTDTSRPEFNLMVSDNEAQLGAILGAGVHSPETLQALLQGSRAAEIMPVLQALQTQPPSTRMTTLQSVLSGTPTGHQQGITDRPSALDASSRSTMSEQDVTPMNLETLPNRAEHRGDETL